MKAKLFGSAFNKQTAELLLTLLFIVLLIFCDVAIFAHAGN
jgi:hypothetical protein